MEHTSIEPVTNRTKFQSPTGSTVPAPPRLTLEPWRSPESTYLFPSLYSFPAFFTRQPNPSVWQHQLSQWINLILSYCRHTRRSTLNLSLATVTDLELFHHRRIHRSLSLETLRAITDAMRAMNPPTIEPVSKSNPNEVYVYWKTPSEWASTIYDWIRETGQQNSILTFYELTQDSPIESLEFYNLPEGLLRKALDILTKQGKCSILKGIGEQGDGVKFV
ncbi:ESCRT-II subunit protein VPS25 [Sporobolomyces koalae]|uniref:ESCRT-II subunit protein VPS25 n=1 Tax=Sporobolomyces koalae TaxID=500713 RepID=UPI003179119C